MVLSAIIVCTLAVPKLSPDEPRGNVVAALGDKALSNDAEGFVTQSAINIGNHLCIVDDCPEPWALNPVRDTGCKPEDKAPQCGSDTWDKTPNFGDDGMNACMESFNTAAKEMCGKVCKWHDDANLETQFAQFDAALGIAGAFPPLEVVTAPIEVISGIAQAKAANDADNWAVTGSDNADLTMALAKCVSMVPDMIKAAINELKLDLLKEKFNTYKEYVATVQYDMKMRDRHSQHGVWITGEPFLEDRDMCDFDMSRCTCANYKFRGEPKGTYRGKPLLKVDIPGDRPRCFAAESKNRDGSPMKATYNEENENNKKGSSTQAWSCPGRATAVKLESGEHRCYFKDFGSSTGCGTCLKEGAKEYRKKQIDRLKNSMSHGGNYMHVMLNSHRMLWYYMLQALDKDVPREVTPESSTAWHPYLKKINLGKTIATVVVSSTATVAAAMLNTVKSLALYCNTAANKQQEACGDEGDRVQYWLKDLQDQLEKEPSREACMNAFKFSASDAGGDYFPLIASKQGLDENGDFLFYPGDDAKLLAQVQALGAQKVDVQCAKVEPASEDSRGTDDGGVYAFYKVAGVTSDFVEKVCREMPLPKALVKIDAVLALQMSQVATFGIDKCYEPSLKRKWVTRHDWYKQHPQTCCLTMEDSKRKTSCSGGDCWSTPHRYGWCVTLEYNTAKCLRIKKHAQKGFSGDANAKFRDEAEKHLAERIVSWTTPQSDYADFGNEIKQIYLQDRDWDFDWPNAYSSKGSVRDYDPEADGGSHKFCSLYIYDDDKERTTQNVEISEAIPPSKENGERPALRPIDTSGRNPIQWPPTSTTPYRNYLVDDYVEDVLGLCWSRNKDPK